MALHPAHAFERAQQGPEQRTDLVDHVKLLVYGDAKYRQRGDFQKAIGNLAAATARVRLGPAVVVLPAATMLPPQNRLQRTRTR